jgi:tellurite resistance protein
MPPHQLQIRKPSMHLNHHDALVYVMVAISSVDRAMTDDEFARIGEIVSKLPVFAECDDNELLKKAETCGEMLSADGGLQQVLQLVREALPEKLRETAYWVALEVADADRLTRPEEIRFLDMLRDALQLDLSTTAAIERAIRARNMTL